MPAGPCADGCGGVDGRLLVEVADADECAASCEQLRCGPADSAATSGDDDDCSVEIDRRVGGAEKAHVVYSGSGVVVGSAGVSSDAGLSDSVWL